MHRTIKLFSALALTVSVAACGTSVTRQAGPPVGSAPSGSAPPALEGRTFYSESITKAGVTSTLLPAEGKPGRAGLSFAAANTIRAGAGCNGVTGTYSLEGAVLHVAAGDSTLMGCPREVEAQDTWFVDLVESRPTLVLAGDTLTLTNGSTVIVFKDRKVVDPDRPLVGTRWTVDTVFGPGGSASAAVGARPVVEFLDDGTSVYTDSCAGGHAKWTRQGDRITFVAMPKRTSDRARTRPPCRRPAGGSA